MIKISGRSERSNRFWCQCCLIFSLLCSCLWTRKIKPVLVSMLSFVVCGHGRSNQFWCQCYLIFSLLCSCLWTRKIKPVLVSMFSFVVVCGHGRSNQFWCQCYPLLFVDTEDQTGFGVNVFLCSCLWTRKIKPVLVLMLSFVVVCGHGRSNQFWCQCCLIFSLLCSCLWTREIKPVLVSMLSSVVVCGHGRSNRFWCQCYPL